MNNKRLDRQKQPQSDLVYDPEYGTWDKPEESVGDTPTTRTIRDAIDRHPRLVKTARNLAVLALASTISYGGVHAAADFAGTKTGSLNTHDISIPTLWNDIVVDLPARITKGF